MVAQNRSAAQKAASRRWLQTPEGREWSTRRRMKGGVYQDTTDEVIRRMKGEALICPYCGGIIDVPHADHVVPLSRGGDHSPENVVICCAKCNLHKGAKYK